MEGLAGRPKPRSSVVGAPVGDALGEGGAAGQQRLGRDDLAVGGAPARWSAVVDERAELGVADDRAGAELAAGAGGRAEEVAAVVGERAADVV